MMLGRVATLLHLALAEDHTAAVVNAGGVAPLVAEHVAHGQRHRRALSCACPVAAG